MTTIYIGGSFERVWYSDHDPLATETDVDGIITAQDILLNTVDGIYYLCTSYDPDNANTSLAWQRIGILSPTELGGLTTVLASALTSPQIVSGTTIKTSAFPIFNAVTVVSGNAVIYLTDDSTSTGTALFPNGPDLNTINVQALDGSTPLTAGTPVLSNSNKTLTIPINRSAGLSVLGLTVLGLPTAANGAVAYISIWGN
jgi:hypothetical protein